MYCLPSNSNMIILIEIFMPGRVTMFRNDCLLCLPLFFYSILKNAKHTKEHYLKTVLCNKRSNKNNTNSPRYDYSSPVWKGK